MSFFPRFPVSEFQPLFRLMDDYDTHRNSRHSFVRSFQPKFDVAEHKDSYELHGELPGINQQDIQIEFTDPNTLVIKGRTEREYTSDDNDKATGRVTGEIDDQQQQSYHKATVEEEGQSTTDKAAGTETQVANKPSGEVGQHKPRVWVSERSVGEFHRSFSFPNRVDQDQVKASLKNGILSVVVPKAAAHQSKRISIE
ncbi:MAG: hypothetical protein M1817_004453 [Caeruleum heppii]|nr:MAG: hypothetical protein M1817_004453 [Caeruleum heppii]